MRKEYLPFSRPTIEQDEIDSVVESLKSGWITTGPKVKQFEKDMQEYLGVKHAIAVNSCTAAVHLSLVASGIKSGDEVITTPMTFVSTPNDIIECGAKPVFVDIDPKTMNINADLIEEKINEKTKALLPVHIGGQPCEMDKIMGLAKKYNLKVFEDAAHAISAEYKDKKIGTIGDTTSFSFYATKNMTTAEGGMVTTNDDELAKLMRIYTLHGISHDAYDRYEKGGSWYYEVSVPGYKYNMTDIAAAMGICQLKKLDRMQKRREYLVSLYDEGFKDVEELEGPYVIPDVKSSWHLYPIKLNLDKLNINRNAFIDELGKRNIGTSVHFIPVHYFPYYKQAFGFKKGDFPQTERTFLRIISLPLYYKMKDEDAKDVIEAVKDIIATHRK